MTPPLWQKVKRNTKNLLMKVIEESEEVGLKLISQKTEIMASGPITLWEIDGETVETVSDFIFGGSKLTADGDCSHEIKRHLLLGRKVMTNLDSILKSRDITLPTKFRLVSSVQFSCSVMSDSLRPHELQHARPPFHHQLPEFTQTHVHCVSDAIQPSHPVIPFSSCFQPFPGSFQMSQFFA